MADLRIVSYDTLKAAVADWLNRNDLVEQIPEFIALAEARIARTLRRTTVTNTVTISGENTSLPVDCVELRGAVLSTGQPSLDKPLQVVTPETLMDVRARSGNSKGRPTHVSVIGTTLRVAPIPDSQYDAVLSYFQKLVPLTSINQSNVVLAEAPDVYLYGTLCAATPFLQHDTRVQMWDAMFRGAVDELNDSRDREEYSASVRPARLPVVF